MSPDDEMHTLAVAGDTILKPLPPVSAWRWMPFIVAIALIAVVIGYAAYTYLG